MYCSSTVSLDESLYAHELISPGIDYPQWLSDQLEFYIPADSWAKTDLDDQEHLDKTGENKMLSFIFFWDEVHLDAKN